MMNDTSDTTKSRMLDNLHLLNVGYSNHIRQNNDEIAQLQTSISILKAKNHLMEGFLTEIINMTYSLNEIPDE